MDDGLDKLVMSDDDQMLHGIQVVHGETDMQRSIHEIFE